MTTAEKNKLLGEAVLAIMRAQDLITAALGESDARWDTMYALQDVVEDIQADMADS